MEIIGLILTNPSTIAPSIPVPNFADFPALAPPGVVEDQRKKFLKFLTKDAKKKKPSTKRRRQVIESITNEEFRYQHVTPYLFPTHATLGIPRTHLHTHPLSLYHSCSHSLNLLQFCALLTWFLNGRTEIEDNTSPKLKTITISVIADFGNVTYGDIFYAGKINF